MSPIEWFKLPRLENEDAFHLKLKIGDKFLYGNRQIDQLQTKEIGQEINFYTVLNISDKSCEYVLSFDVLERN